MTDARITSSSDGTPFEDDPDHGRVLIAGSTTGNAYSLMEWIVSPRPVSADGQQGFGPHEHHSIDEVFVIRHGTVEFLLDDIVTTLTTGDVVRVPAGTRHGYRNTSHAPVEMLVWFAPGGFEELFVKYRTDRPPVDGKGFVNEATQLFNTTFEG